MKLSLVHLRAAGIALCALLLSCLLAHPQSSVTPDLVLTGSVTDPASHPAAHAHIDLVDSRGVSRAQGFTNLFGQFRLIAPMPGAYSLVAIAPGFAPCRKSVVVPNSQPVALTLTLAATETVTVTSSLAAVDLQSPDPSEKVFVDQQLLDANPGRPGAPVSLPGYPIETASGGIKAPQYFAPGVAGDHGEPIAQFIAVGAYLLPNNLSANAHGNGYADPNLLIPATLSYVQVDGGSFNVLEGNHAMNLAATYGPRSSLAPFVSLTGDQRDFDIAAASSNSRSWIAFEIADGNGLLNRLERRQQYKLNTLAAYAPGAHRITLFAVGYYARGYIPGLIPIATASSYPDTIDPRQREQTHTALLAASDTWTLSQRQRAQFSAFFRTYNLSLYSDFGGGLIRQSEFRTVTGTSSSYTAELPGSVSLLAGLDFQREAPRNDDLNHYDFYTPGVMTDGPPTPIFASDITIAPVTPYVALRGSLTARLHWYAGWRRDQIDFTNDDLLQPARSFHLWTGVNSPKATVSYSPARASWSPVFSASAGESFFTEDPRIGTGTSIPTPVARAHAYQFVASETVAHTQFKFTLGQLTTGQQLAKIDPDTGLQEDQGPGRVRFLTAGLQQTARFGSLLVTVSKADARDLDTGQPTAEAPRTLVDILGTATRLPLRLQAKSEFEYVPAKTLGTGCAPDFAAQCLGVPVREFRLAAARAFRENRAVVSVNVLAASGFTGQTLQSFYPSADQTPAGVRIPSNASLSLTWNLHKSPAH